MLASTQIHTELTPMQTPTYFLVNPAQRKHFRLTRKGFEELDSRFARCDINVMDLKTIDDWRDAIDDVQRLEFEELEELPAEDQNQDSFNAILDLSFCLDPLEGIAPMDLDERRKLRDKIARLLFSKFPMETQAAKEG